MPPGTLFFLEKAGKELFIRALERRLAPRLCERLAHVRGTVLVLSNRALER